MEEQNIIELSNDIVEGLMRLSMGEEPGLFSNKVYKSLATNENLNEIKELVAAHFVWFKGKYESTEDLKVLSDFRYNIVNVYNKKTTSKI